MQVVVARSAAAHFGGQWAGEVGTSLKKGTAWAVVGR
jgi:hypothetical protein